ncbi:DUF4468 domain-containing protein [Aequorivita capsosiphonis]|uniref:DUF4468 domain-containing protein n=1 Tax=Aequorivita capsosiphonis TaxID=487317 RepID=UPI00047B92BD|nr:DUF4468 domain-containing protein [Aequorivita capsosiphonis]
MKVFFTFLILSITVFSCKAPQPVVNIGTISETMTIEENKDDLYIKSNNWMVETFVSAKSVVQFSDKETGIVTGRYLLKETFKEQNGIKVPINSIYAIIKIQVKDNACKISITPEEFYESRSFTKNNPMNIDESMIRFEIGRLISSYKNYIETDNTLDFYQD